MARHAPTSRLVVHVLFSFRAPGSVWFLQVETPETAVQATATKNVTRQLLQPQLGRIVKPFLRIEK